MDKKSLEGLKKEEENKMEIDDTKKAIRHLEIELEYVEETEPHNYKYLNSLEAQIDNLYKKLDKLYEVDEVSKS